MDTNAVYSIIIIISMVCSYILLISFMGQMTKLILASIPIYTRIEK